MEPNEALARRYFDDFWTGQQYDAADDLMAADHRHHISGSTLAAGRDSVKEMARSMHAAFPDLVFVIEDVLVDGAGSWFGGLHTAPIPQRSVASRRPDAGSRGPAWT